MVKKRIDELDAITGAQSATGDNLAIYDVSSSDAIKTKKITRAELAKGLVGDLPYTPSGGIAASTIVSAIAELDTEKAASTTLAASGGAALIGNNPAGTISATTVQGAINEIVSDLAASGGAALVGNSPSGNIAATTVQAAINELDSEKQASSFTQAGTGAVTRTFTSKVRDVVNALDFGMVGDGSTDNTAAFNNAIAVGATGVYGVLYIPAGSYRFASQPNSLGTVSLCGQDPQHTVLIRDYNGSGNTGLIDFTPGTSNGVIVERMAITSGSGRSGGSAISAIASSSFGVSNTSLRHLYITPGSVTDAFTQILYYNGTGKTTGAIGNRGNSIYDVTAFGASYATAYFGGCEGLTWQGGSLAAAGGTGTYTGGIQIDGSAGVPSNYVVIEVSNINGAINLNYCSAVRVITTAIGSVGGVSVWNSANTSYTRILYTSLDGTVQANWTNSGAST